MNPSISRIKSAIKLLTRLEFILIYLTSVQSRIENSEINNPTTLWGSMDFHHFYFCPSKNFSNFYFFSARKNNSLND